MRRVLPLLALHSPAVAPVPPDRPTPGAGKADLEAMQGAWVLDHSHSGGVRSAPDAQETVWLVEGDAVTTTWGGAKSSRFYITLDAEPAPRAIDVRPRG